MAAPPANLGPCSACMFWDNAGPGGPSEGGPMPVRTEPTPFGLCRVSSPAYAPSPWQAGGGQLTAQWPMTRADDWCGEWQD